MRTDCINTSQSELIRSCLTGEYELIWLIGTSTGIRISDILQLRAKQFLKSEIYIKEIKTGKSRRIYLSKEIRALAQERIKKYNISPNERMFEKSRVQVWRVFKKAAQKCDINTNVGTHTMRKTYSKAYIEKGHTVDELQKRLNHKHINDTIGYITPNDTLGLDSKGYPKRKRGIKK